MKTDLNILELAQKIQDQSKAKEDVVVPAKEIAMSGFSQDQIVLPGTGSLEVTDLAHSQIGNWTGIPARYYNKLRADNQQMLAANVNHWLHHDANKAKRRLVRTLHGQARAFLSDRYFRLDNDLVGEVALEALYKNDMQLASSSITDKHMYIKALKPSARTEVKVGDVIEAGVVVRNSEVGCGRLEVFSFIHRLKCLNGWVGMDNLGGVTRNHLGAMIRDDQVEYSKQTIRLVADATISQVRDAITHFTSDDYLSTVADLWRDGAESTQIQRPTKAVEVLSKTIGLSDLEGESVLEALLRDGDMSKYGAMNAVTNIANNMDSYQRASELESLGSKVITLTPTQWEVIAEAA